MSTSTKYSPTIRVEKTISVPYEPSVVMGFEARNTKLGRDAMLFKRDVMPSIKGVIGIPNKQAERVTDEQRDVFVLSDVNVVELRHDQFEDVTRYQTFENWHGERETCPSFSVDEACVWQRNQVEVTY